jgi:hypothetical protein
MVNRGVNFPESAAVPVAMQPRPIWRCGTPRRVSDSVGDVLGVRRGEQTGSKSQSLVQTSFKSVLSLRSLTWPGGVDLAEGCYSLGVGDHLETFCLPQAPLRSQLESWRAGR